MKVGDYVRTTSGIERLKKENDNGWFFEKNMIIKPDNIEKYIIKSSPNIIDLIEVGDYVNGSYIYSIVEENKNTGQPRVLFTEEDGVLGSGEIKAIVTKEQFEQMEYRIGE